MADDDATGRSSGRSRSDRVEGEPVVDWTRVLGGALAAVSSAVLLSRLGAVGTLAGAALGSIVVSVFGSLYAHGLSRSRRRMAQAQEAALRRVGIAQAEVSRARRRTAPGATDAHLDRADHHLQGARDRLEALPDPASETLLERLRRLPWRRVAVVAVLVFAIAIAAITAFELVAGRPVSSYTGGTRTHHGTSFSDLGRSSGRDHGPPSPSPTTTAPASPSSASTGGVTTPSSSPSQAPTATPSLTPSPTPTPSAPASSAPAATPSG